MKINIYQKIILALYGILFIYFSIIHVPFKLKYSNEIEYDSLFSSKSNLDISRLVLVIIIMTVLATILFLLFRNLFFTPKLKTQSKKIFRSLMYILIGVIILWSAIFLINNNRTKNKSSSEIIKRVDSAAIYVDTISDLPSHHELKKAENCTEKNVLYQFESYMKFSYPDWKVYGKPVVQETSDCVYQIRFTSMNPHLKKLGVGEKEIIIVQISFTYDYGNYYFRIVRGTLY